ncbi:MAG: HDOD domain-containing protein [Gammaproteobacteria bacterium]|nr:HDOD domain-containing protein [Gammaproteobacteria bacterium]MDH5651925.1 HDOD domain-containing protein [Gammaproteobacteria bacterium]
MLINQVILTLLQQHIPHQILRKPDHASLDDGWLSKAVPPRSLTTCSILQDNAGLILAIYPANHQIALEQLNTSLRRKLGFIDSTRLTQLLQLIKPTAADNDPAVPSLQIIIDEVASNQDQLNFELPHHRILRISSEHLAQIPYPMLLGSTFSSPKKHQTVQTQAALAALNIRDQVQQIDSLPPMPETARQLLAISNSPNSTLQQINKAISTDPALAALIIRYANSAMFGMKGEIKDLNDAIFRVLGFDGTLYLAMGIVLGRRFKLAEKGVLSRINFWQRSMYSATLAQKLAMQIPKNHRPNPGLAYLAGLLHDIGYLILAEKFETSYQWLNTYATANDMVPVSTLEQLFLGIHHSELGGILMQAWELPREVVLAIRYHHDSSYNGLYSEYANLILLCDRLLKPHDLSYADSEEIPQDLCAGLRLDEEQIYTVMDEVIQGDETLRGMATNLSA